MHYLRRLLSKLGLLSLIRNSYIWKIKNKNLTTTFSNNAKHIFQEVISLYESEGIEIWPEFGTLLGIIRDKNFIKHDLDLDFGIFGNKVTSEKIRDIMLGHGFIPTVKCLRLNENKHQVISTKFVKNKVDVDIYFFYEHSNQIDKLVLYGLETDNGLSVEEEFAYYGKLSTYENLFSKFNLGSMNIFDTVISIPSNIHQHLIELYGPDYVIPDPNWHSSKRINRQKDKAPSILSYE